jgi:hypothetical protein
MRAQVCEGGKRRKLKIVEFLDARAYTVERVEM